MASSSKFANAITELVVSSESEEATEILYRAEFLMGCAMSLVDAGLKKLAPEDQLRYYSTLKHISQLVDAGKSWLNRQLWALGYYGDQNEGRNDAEALP